MIKLNKIIGSERSERIVEGKYSSAKIFAETVDDTALMQIRQLCDQPFVKDCKIRIMPDVGAGNGCVIGFTADLGEMVIPSVVGVDIGCGMLTVNLGKADVDCDKLDSVIREYVPNGMGKDGAHGEIVFDFPELEDLVCYKSLKRPGWIRKSLGSLGGGNHFIEIDEDGDGEKYLVIHTGSRSLGVAVEHYYEELAYDFIRWNRNDYAEKHNEMIAKLKEQGRFKEIESAIRALKSEFDSMSTDVPRTLCYLTDKKREMYLHDMKICQKFACMNRRCIAELILKNLFGNSIDDYEHFETIHNYIDFDDNVVRKGSVSARKGERLLIPINMRDGALICVGKGNEDWNSSAPHGAGRFMSRTTAAKTISLNEYKASMAGIYSTCVCEETIDESPMAYKPMEEILRNITPTVDIIKQIKPIYNFKAIG